MSRSLVSPGVALAFSAVVFTGCGSTVTGPASRNQPSSVATSSGAHAQVAAKSSPTLVADPLAALPRSKFSSVLLTSAQVAVFTPSMTKQTVSANPDKLTGKGGTCPALAAFLGSRGMLGSIKANTVSVSYENSATSYAAPATTKTPTSFRSLDQVVESSPERDMVAQLRLYRSAAAGCSTPLNDQYGSKIEVRPLPDPENLGAESLAIEVVYSDGTLKTTSVLRLTASGHNSMGVATTGYSAKDQAAIFTRAWKNVAALRR